MQCGSLFGLTQLIRDSMFAGVVVENSFPFLVLTIFSLSLQ